MFFYDVECFVISLIVGGWIERDGGDAAKRITEMDTQANAMVFFFFRPGNLQANNTVITTKRKKTKKNRTE